MEDWTRIRATGQSRQPGTSLPQPMLLVTILVLLTAYRMWVIPHLGVTLYIDEAQYWTWAQHLDWGYYSKPPLIAWLIRLCTSLFGDGLVAVKLPSLVLYPATAWVLFKLGEYLFDARTGFRAGLALAFIPLVSVLGLAVSTDAPLLFLWTAAMYFLVRAIDEDRMPDWLMLGLCVGLGVMAKYTMAAFGASALLYLLLDARRRRILLQPGLWVAVVVACLVVTPNIVWNWAHHFPTLHHTEEITHVIGNNTKHGNLGEFLGAQAGSLGPGFALAFLAGLYVAARHHLRDKRYQFLLCFSLPLLALVVVQSIRSEANGNWAAPALITSLLLGVVWMCQSQRSRWWWIGALGINVLAMFGAYHLEDFFRLSGHVQTARLDPLKRVKGWDSLAMQLRPILVEHRNAVLMTSDRTMMAHLLYQLRDFAPDHVAWAPNAFPADHYQLTTPLTEASSARPLLFVTQDDSYADITARFAHNEVLAIINVMVEPGLERHATVLLLEGFQGYAKPTVTQ
jgi:4-amino-4-deoxy-L-arabinose transferase-like glycosyltransferase